MKIRPKTEEILGGESACFAHLLCETCGAVLDGTHLQPCPLDDQNARTSHVIDETELDQTTS
jgi:hypothetical protein